MTERVGTRERLLEAAISIIETDGEDGVRVDRVAEIAGFTKPVVYHHFADREALVVAALTERYFRSISYSMDDLKFAAARCRTVEQYSKLLRETIMGFGTPEGVHRRQIRIEALGAAVSRPDLRASLIEANRRQIVAFGEILQIGREEGWLRVDVDPGDLAAWWTGMVLSRHIVEIDEDAYDPNIWSDITDWVIQRMIAEPDASA
jgi:AcrR family transcriptional regulator